ncbi:hypothetical protein EHRUM3_10880 [Ehrlichia ruminantium]|uniref:Uncharacterized protein n=1 Tax=Ehrlichia ruminantium TaxID=779 RepID=A0A170TGE3_EHRRU|nr:hypothetical protein EHRUM3_10880 [Ehrlichia ruminantium]
MYKNYIITLWIISEELVDYNNLHIFSLEQLHHKISRVVN